MPTVTPNVIPLTAAKTGHMHSYYCACILHGINNQPLGACISGADFVVKGDAGVAMSPSVKIRIDGSSDTVIQKNGI